LTATVGDLFCGAGGFSEGFRQAGFKIVWALDNWEAARTTYHNNHPRPAIIEDDISTVDFRELPRVDVLIGGPPCTFFSLANKAGNGHMERGLELVLKFTEAVRILRPKYWVMENVPQLGSVVGPNPIKPHRKVSLPKLRRVLKYLPTHTVLNAADFAVPQKRRRIFYGKFPLPRKVISDPAKWIPMKTVINALPYPLFAPNPEGSVIDPLYSGVKTQVGGLTDHFMDTRMDADDVELSRRGKLDHYWGGPMAFPDSLDKPARSIVAKVSKSTRQSIVIQDERGPSSVYRTPTIRESASFQGFPITYQFWGNSPHSRYVLVGNAVPPPLARSIAMEIRADMGLSTSAKIRVSSPRTLAPNPTLFGNGPKHRLAIRRPYRQYIPGTVRYSCRVDFDNRGTNPVPHPAGFGNHLVEWETTLALGYARDYATFRVNFLLASSIALLLSRLGGDGATKILQDVVRRAADDFGRTVPDASTLQAIWAKRMTSSMGPDWVVERIRHLCTSAFENAGMRGDDLKGLAKDFLPLLRSVKLASGKDFRKAKWKKERIPFYAACCLVATSIAAAFANQGSHWVRENWTQAFKGDPLTIPDVATISLSGLGPDQIMTAFLRLQNSDLKNVYSTSPQLENLAEAKLVGPVELGH
jgi:site-specific DNA-cytosine methylase